MALIERINRTKWRYLFYLFGAYLIVVNLLYLNGEVSSAADTLRSRVRLFSPISQPGAKNGYAFYMKLPQDGYPLKVRLYLTTMSYFSGTVEQVHVMQLNKTGSS